MSICYFISYHLLKKMFLFYICFWQQAVETMYSSFGLGSLDHQGPDNSNQISSALSCIFHSKGFNISLNDSFHFSQTRCPLWLNALKQQQQKAMNVLVLSLFPGVACSDQLKQPEWSADPASTPHKRKKNTGVGISRQNASWVWTFLCALLVQKDLVK